MRIEQPRDRKGSFEPQIVPKHQRRFDGFDDKIVAMYARGMSVRDIQAHLRELYGVEVGHDLISRVTDAVLDDVRAWQARPLEDVYPILFLDALIVKVRDGGAVRNKACYVAIGVNLDGERDVLGLWFQSSEGAKFWLAGPQRAEAARRPRRAHLLRRRPQGLPRGDRGGLPAGVGADLHRPPDPPVACASSPTSTAAQVANDLKTDLHRRRRRRRRSKHSSPSSRTGASATR